MNERKIIQLCERQRIPERKIADARTFQRVVLSTFQKQKAKIMRLYQRIEDLENRIERFENEKV